MNSVQCRVIPNNILTEQCQHVQCKACPGMTERKEPVQRERLYYLWCLYYCRVECRAVISAWRRYIIYDRTRLWEMSIIPSSSFSCSTPPPPPSITHHYSCLPPPHPPPTPWTSRTAILSPSPSPSFIQFSSSLTLLLTLLSSRCLFCVGSKQPSACRKHKGCNMHRAEMYFVLHILYPVQYKRLQCCAVSRGPQEGAGWGSSTGVDRHNHEGQHSTALPASTALSSIHLIILSTLLQTPLGCSSLRCHPCTLPFTD